MVCALQLASKNSLTPHADFSSAISRGYVLAQLTGSSGAEIGRKQPLLDASVTARERRALLRRAAGAHQDAGDRTAKKFVSACMRG